MPRPRSQKPPAYSLHRASGQAVARVNGRDHYLEPYGSPESHAAYDRLQSEWLAQQLEKAAQAQASRTPSQQRPAAKHMTVAEVILRYWRFAETYYVKNGQPTHELSDMKYSLRPVRRLYGDTYAADFGPLALKAIQAYMIEQEKLSRRVINQRINRIKRFWKWSVSEELVPASVYHSLQTVSGLRYGRTTAREKPPVLPVEDKWIEATLPYMTPQLQAIVQLQRLTGVRPCELLVMRACDIDRQQEIWIYRLPEHKNSWRGHDRTVPLGYKAQKILESYLQRDPQQYLFSPAESEAHHASPNPQIENNTFSEEA